MAKKAKPVKKLKPVDPATYARFRREKRCFEPEHLKRIEEYALQVSQLNERAASLEAELKRLAETTVDKAILEEHEKTSFYNGLHEGQKEMEEAFRKEKRCFNKMHGFVDNKTPMNLNFGEVIGLFAKLTRDPMSGGMSARITVMVPYGIDILRMTEGQSLGLGMELLKGAAAKVENKDDEKDKKGGP